MLCCGSHDSGYSMSGIVSEVTCFGWCLESSELVFNVVVLQ